MCDPTTQLALQIALGSLGRTRIQRSNSLIELGSEHNETLLEVDLEDPECQRGDNIPAKFCEIFGHKKSNMGGGTEYSITYNGKSHTANHCSECV